MAPVYSSRFAGIQGLDGVAGFTVPPGVVWVLRDLDAYYNGFTVASIHLLGSTMQTIWYNGFGGGGNPQYASWRGRQVLNPGEGFQLTTDQAIDVTVSGYVLTLP